MSVVHYLTRDDTVLCGASVRTEPLRYAHEGWVEYIKDYPDYDVTTYAQSVTCPECNARCLAAVVPPGTAVCRTAHPIDHDAVWRDFCAMHGLRE